MIDVTSTFKFAVLNGSTDNQIKIYVFDTAEDVYTIGNDEIVSESMKIKQSLCDESDLKFGGCIASEFEIETSRDIDLTGKYITVGVTQTATVMTYPGSQTFPSASTYPGGYAESADFALFSGEVYSCKLSKSRVIRTLIAYDRMYWRGGIDCTTWYNKWFASNADSDGQVTIGALRGAVLSKFKLVEENDSDHDTYIALPADDLPVYQLTDSTTVADILRQICEFNGCFLYFNGGGIGNR